MSPQGAGREAIVVHVFAKTDLGRTREHNEDTFLVVDLTPMNATNALMDAAVQTHAQGERGSLFMVADGMGGAAAGEIASAMAVETVLHELDARWRQSADRDADTFARAVKTATEAANARIHRYAIDHPEYRGMGTTATIAGLLGDTLFLAQVGDSRAYLVRSGVARQLTKDQSLMQRLVEAGELTQEEADLSERRNIILQALGPEPIVKVDLTHQRVSRDDVLVLCSDGLSGQMRTEDISRIVQETPSLEGVCSALIDLANANGGPDNITVIAVRFEGPGLALASDADDVGHSEYRSAEDQRATLAIDAKTLPGYEALKDTEEFTTSPASKAARSSGGKRGDAAPASLGVGPRPVAPRAGPTPDAPRVPVSTLRWIFGVIGLAVAAVALWRILSAR